jgi:hypothetical protein
MQLMRFKAEVEVLEQEWNDKVRTAQSMGRGESWSACVFCGFMCGLLAVGVGPASWVLGVIFGACFLLCMFALRECIGQRKAFQRQCAAAGEAERAFRARNAELRTQLGMSR